MRIEVEHTTIRRLARLPVLMNTLTGRMILFEKGKECTRVRSEKE